MFRPTSAALVALALSAVLFVSGCVRDDGAGGDESVEVSSASIDQGAYGQGPASAEDRVISDPDAWGAFWAEHAQRSQRSVEPAEMDFDTEFAVFVYGGERSTGGHAVNVTDVRLDDETYLVTVQDIRPGQDCMTTQALTYPYHLVRVERAATAEGVDGLGSQAPLEVDFAHQEVVQDC